MTTLLLPDSVAFAQEAAAAAAALRVRLESEARALERQQKQLAEQRQLLVQRPAGREEPAEASLLPRFRTSPCLRRSWCAPS